MSFFRRAGAEILRLIERASDANPATLNAAIYAKREAGVTQIFAQASDRIVYQMTPIGVINPTSISFSFDDFLGNELSTIAVTAGGTNGFGMAMGSNHPGTITSSVTAVGDATRISVGGNSNQSIYFGGGQADFESMHQIPVLSNGVNNVVVRDGYGDSANLDYTDGVWLEYDLAVNGSQNYFLCTANAGVRNRVDTGRIAVAGANRKLTMRVNAAGTLVTAAIDGVASANSLALTIPVTAARVTQISLQTTKQAGAGAMSVFRDYYWHRQTFTVPR